MSTQKFRIVFPTGSFFPAQTGGPDNTVYWITKALTRRGHQPVICTTDRGQPDSMPRNRWLNTDYGCVIYTTNLIHYFPLGVLGQSTRKIGSADILHLAMITYPVSWIIAIINSFFYDKPVIWSTHGDLDPPILLRSRRKKRFVIWLINKMVKNNKLYFHSTCNAESTYIRNNFGADSKIIQIPNYMELPERVEVPKEQYFLFIGRIDPKKAVENLIAGLAASAAFRASGFVLKIVGEYDNDYGRALVVQARASGLQEKIQFLGHRAGREKEVLLAAAWFLIMPSHTENFGIVVTEALAQGTPAIASTGTPWAILPETGTGYWVDNDPATLAATIDEVLALTPEVLEQMSRNSLQLAMDNFDIHNKIGEWEAAYQRVLR